MAGGDISRVRRGTSNMDSTCIVWWFAAAARKDAGVPRGRQTTILGQNKDDGGRAAQQDDILSSNSHGAPYRGRKICDIKASPCSFMRAGDGGWHIFLTGYRVCWRVIWHIGAGDARQRRHRRRSPPRAAPRWIGSGRSSSI